MLGFRFHSLQVLVWPSAQLKAPSKHPWGSLNPSLITKTPGAISPNMPKSVSQGCRNQVHRVACDHRNLTRSPGAHKSETKAPARLRSFQNPEKRISVASPWILDVLGRPWGSLAYRCVTAVSVWVATWLSPVCVFPSYSSRLLTANSPLFTRTPVTLVQGPILLQYDVISTNDISNGPVSQ